MLCPPGLGGGGEQLQRRPEICYQLNRLQKRSFWNYFWPKERDSASICPSYTQDSGFLKFFYSSWQNRAVFPQSSWYMRNILRQRGQVTKLHLVISYCTVRSGGFQLEFLTRTKKLWTQDCCSLRSKFFFIIVFILMTDSSMFEASKVVKVPLSSRQ